ncbi:hypothetical protein HELRODRAFT_163563 [Helobdella robusta]|uniref:Uncharacterized protein n=1 Tax=Helobdella robusta TaxID=6412 RepID=T1EU76_HELRO|nr:hypothetical protein HELRODRAFT_163563 [Helobdella robusta]ESN96495.1 hypothetical protein HELRODRAFT_163563 [Helobdella robusta]
MEHAACQCSSNFYVRHALKSFDIVTLSVERFFLFCILLRGLLFYHELSTLGSKRDISYFTDHTDDHKQHHNDFKNVRIKTQLQRLRDGREAVDLLKKLDDEDPSNKCIILNMDVSNCRRVIASQLRATFVSIDSRTGSEL